MLGIDASAVFFGNQGWQNVGGDLAGIHHDKRRHFILSLFMLVITEQCIHVYFRKALGTWRAHTGFPLFGWTRGGIHNENPYHILRAPVACGLADEAAAVALAPALASLFSAEVESFFPAIGLGIASRDFFAALRADSTYKPATLGLVRGIYQTAAVPAEPVGTALVRAVALALGPLA